MKKYLSIALVLFILLWLNNRIYAGNIDLVVSPIKYEIVAQPGSTVIKTAKLINKSTDTLIIHTWKSDFISNDSTGNPTFVRKSELVNPDQELASWININTENFNIWPLEEKDIEFSINIPTNATPGWHYWAVFFKNNWDENSWSGWQIKINVDYWVLILVNVDWEIIDNWTPWDTTINVWPTTWYAWWALVLDSCPFWDLTKSRIDWKCIDDFWLWNIIDSITWNNNWNTDSWTTNDNLWNWNNDWNSNSWTTNDISWNLSDNQNSNSWTTNEDFVIDFWIPFNNDWNTHIKPTWKITLIDEDWNQIKWVWKEIIENEDGAIIWEKIVDYIPINDNGWNILPNTQRIFQSEWKWFPYEAYDENWKKIIKYWSPSDYYSKKNIEDKTFIYPWERINETIEQKKIKALIELAYENYKWEEIKFNSAKEFSVDYIVKSVWINPYFIIWLIFSLWLFWFFFIIWRRKTKKKCHHCKKRINKKMKICPYCWEHQKEKKK